MKRCANCGKVLGEPLKTVYGDYLCEDCWDDYICSKEGKLEYLIGICNHDYPAAEFDDDFLKEVAVSWEANKTLVKVHIPGELFIKADAKAGVFHRL